MATATVQFEAGSMPVTMAVSGFDGSLESTPANEIDSSRPSKNINRLRDLKTSARDQLMIDPRIILIDDSFNPRNYDLPENHAHLDALKRSIRENGTLVPLLVRYDAERRAAVLVDGECRLRANLELIAEGVEIETVPTIQVPGGNEQDRLLTAITANTGKPLSKWELGGAFQRLYNHGWSEEKIATRTGYADRFIREAMELADAPDEIKQLLSSQAVTPSLALAELRANGAAAVETLKAAANAAQSSGQKTAKRAKAKTLPPAKPRKADEPAPEVQTAPVPAAQPVNGKAKHAPKSQAALCPEVMKALVDLMSDVALNELNNDKVKRVSVDKELLLKLASFMVTEEEAKHILAGDVAF
jgi:ParB/RepB/Spo0J family partition protein